MPEIVQIQTGDLKNSYVAVNDLKESYYMASVYNYSEVNKSLY